MAIRVPVETIMVVRDGKQISPKIGEPFNFTAEELADIKRINPDAIRFPVSEVAEEVDDTAATAAAAAAAAKGGKKTPAAAGNNNDL